MMARKKTWRWMKNTIGIAVGIVTADGVTELGAGPDGTGSGKRKQ